MFITRFQVRFSETDALGHVNNTVFYVYMEEARRPIFQIFNPHLELEKWNLIIARTSCDYLKQVKYGEELRIETFIQSIGNKSLTVLHDLYSESTGGLVAKGSAVAVYYNYEQQCSETIPDEIRSQLAAHLKMN